MINSAIVNVLNRECVNQDDFDDIICQADSTIGKLKGFRVLVEVLKLDGSMKTQESFYEVSEGYVMKTDKFPPIEKFETSEIDNVKKKRRPQSTFEKYGISIGTVLEWLQDRSVKFTVMDNNNKVKCPDGEIRSLSAAVFEREQRGLSTEFINGWWDIALTGKDKCIFYSEESTFNKNTGFLRG